ncbi:MAG: PAS domain-containing protein [Bacteroidia bacterium]|nr:PAS domain-containing protein [Bacteroidia bacterium]
MLKILYLEDNKIDAILIQHLVKEEGLDTEFTLVSSRKNFENALVKNKFDLVLVDFDLPDINAREALHLIRKKGIIVPVILVSGAISGEAAVEILKAGASDYILKDHLPRLVPAINRALENHQNEQRIKAHEIEITKNHTILRQAELLGKLGSFEWDFVKDKLILTSGLKLILGLEEDEYLPELNDILAQIFPEDLYFLTYKVGQALTLPNQKNIQFIEDFRVLSKADEQKYVNSTGEIFFDSQGAPLKMVGVVQDISQQKAAEAAISRLNEELEQKVILRTEELAISQEKYRLISENISDLILEIERDGEYSYVSKSLKSILGYEPSEFAKLKSSDLLHPDDYPRVVKDYEKTFGMAKNQFRSEFRVRHLDGHYVWLESDIKISLHSPTPPYPILASCRDITQRKLMQQEKEEALKQEKKLMEMQAKFVSIASHQFRTPLSVIRSNVELLDMIREQGKLSEKARNFRKICERLNGEVDHLTSLMDDILEMGRIEQGNITAHMKCVDLLNLIDLIISHEAKILGPDRNVEFSVEGEPYNLMLDPHLLTNVLINVLSNAFKYSQGAKDPEIRLVYGEENTSLSVVDYGIGIPTEEQERLFESWFRASNTNGIRGTGLGLSISKKFIEAMGGDISFKSELGKGTTFYIKFLKCNNKHEENK